ncbi:MAG: galactose oxidase-like domain-containing protein [Mycobacteriales bacterium]
MPPSPHSRPSRRTAVGLAAVGALVATGLPLALVSPAGAAVADPSVVGRFASPFEEAGPKCTKDRDQRSLCKPAGASVVVLPNGKLVFWDALEGMEDVRYGVVPEYGNTAQNDFARVLDLRGGKPVYTLSDPNPASNPGGGDKDFEYLPGGTYNNDEKRNDGDLFCSDQVQLSNGKVLDAGGTAYYLEPGAKSPLGTYGVSELEGLKNSRLYDPVTNRWSASGQMTYGRWYPSLVTLADNRVLVVSGVTKLIKPAYDKRPTDSGANVTQPEVYTSKTGKWSTLPATANKSLPLFPRMHLLPNGNAYYDAAGQTFNPSGQSYDEATWNMAASFNPATNRWTDLGLPEFDGIAKGFRGSGFSQMLTLSPNAAGAYDTARFLGAGGVYGVSPGTYVATNSATVNTVQIGAGGKETFSSKVVAPMNQRRWYGSGVTLATGQVVVVNGADRDEVVAPGSGTPVRIPEMYDPETNTWTKLAMQAKGRTYKNTAVLLPDGRILVGGHAPIATGYASQQTAGTQAGLSSPLRDPSFEILSPPNLFYGPRPVITLVNPSVALGRTLDISTPDAASVATVTLVRNTSLTHLVDADQRVVELPVVKRTGDTVTVRVTDNAAVLPQGPYNVVVSKRYAKGLTPSIGRQVYVGPVPHQLAGTLKANQAQQIRAERSRKASATGLRPSAPAAAAAPVAPSPTVAAPVTQAVAAVRSLGDSNAVFPLGVLGLAMLGGAWWTGGLITRRRRAER